MCFAFRYILGFAIFKGGFSWCVCVFVFSASQGEAAHFLGVKLLELLLGVNLVFPGR